MILNADMDAPNVYCIITDDVKSMEEAGKFLLKDKEDVLYLYNAHSNSGKRKIQGFENACKKSGIAIKEERIRYFDGYHGSIFRKRWKPWIYSMFWTLREQFTKNLLRTEN